MPFAMNGIGTVYYGKRNLERTEATCAGCQQTAVLECYETSLFFSLLYIPILRLGRRQVLNHCSACTRHQTLPVDDWERVRREAIEESAAEMRLQSESPEASIQMHATLDAFHQRKEARSLAETMLARFFDQPSVLQHLGGWFDRIGDDGQADACFSRLLELEPDDLATRRAVAIGRIQQGRLEEARNLLAALRPPSSDFEPSVFLLLAEAYQELHDHESALEILRLILVGAPEVAEDPEFRRALRRSEREVGVRATLLPVAAWQRSSVLFWSVAAALAVIFTLGSNYYIQANRTVFVVNGLAVPITVLIDRAPPLEVGPRTHRQVRLAEGWHQVVTRLPQGGQSLLADFHFQTSWLDRFARKPGFVIDPARSAVIVTEELRHGQEVSGQRPQGETHVAKIFTHEPDIDYLFTEFPRSLQTRRRNVESKRLRLTQLPLTPIQVLTGYAGFLKRDDALQFAELHLQASPDDDALVSFYCGMSSRLQRLERCRDFLATGLADRPVRLTWHRGYQTARELLGESAGLAEMYDGYLAGEPRDSALLYLRGRLEGDSDRAADLYQRSLDADPQNPFPRSARSEQLLAEGELPAARALAAEACSLAHEDQDLRLRYNEIRLALGEYEAVMEDSAAVVQQSLDIEFQKLLLSALLAMGRKTDAMDAHERFSQRVRLRNPGDLRQLGRKSRLHLRYLEGNFDDMLEGTRALNDQQLALKLAWGARLERGETPPIPADLDPDEAGLLHLCRGLALGWEGVQPAADDFAAALAAFRRGSALSRPLARTLEQVETVGIAELQKLRMKSQAKAILLLSVATRRPDLRHELLALAERLNYSQEFPYYFLRRQIAARRTAAPVPNDVSVGGPTLR